MRSIMRNLSEFSITEVIYNLGVSDFDKNDLAKWKSICSSDFLNYYMNNTSENIERSQNTIECYYNGEDFNNNIEAIPFNNKEFGMIELSRVPLYSIKTNEKIGLVHWLCIENKYEKNSYIDCSLVYYIDNKFIPANIKNVNKNINETDNYSIARFNFSYLSRSENEGTFFREGDYFASKGYFSLESGLNKTMAISNIFLPKDNTGKGKRSVVLNFPTISSNNFISQDQYGTLKNSNELDKILSYIDNEFSSPPSIRPSTLPAKVASAEPTAPAVPIKPVPQMVQQSNTTKAKRPTNIKFISGKGIHFTA